MLGHSTCSDFFLFNTTATTEIYTLSLHDALPILMIGLYAPARTPLGTIESILMFGSRKRRDRKSTRLNSSHLGISYAVFCLKKKKDDVTILVPNQGLVARARRNVMPATLDATYWA